MSLVVRSPERPLVSVVGRVEYAAGEGDPFSLPILNSIVGFEHNSQSTTLSPIPICPGPWAPDRSLHLPRPEASSNLKSMAPDLVQIYDAVREWGVPNYRGSRIAINSDINIDSWRARAHIYNDDSLANMLQYGFPCGHLARKLPKTDLPKHSSAIRNPAHVRKFLDKEVRLGAMAGPFASQTFNPWRRTNPLMTRPKRASNDLRVILDLSFPKGESVNSGNSKECLDGAPFKL